MDGFNFVRNRLPVSAILEQLARYAQFEDPPSVAVQSAPIVGMPAGLCRGKQPFGPRSGSRAADLDRQSRHRAGPLRRVAEPRLRRRRKAPVHAVSAGTGCQPVCGSARLRPHRRRNEHGACSPSRISKNFPGSRMRSPRPASPSSLPAMRSSFRRCGGTTSSRSTAKLNVLVNYWWNGALGTVDRTASAMDCLLHCLLNIRPMPAELRQAWASLFDHYVFRRERRRPRAHTGHQARRAREAVSGSGAQIRESARDLA